MTHRVLNQHKAKNTLLVLTLTMHQQSIRDRWLLKFEQKGKPRTVKSYLHSLSFFYKFILCNELEEYASFIMKYNSMIVAMERQLAIYRKQVQQRCWKKDLQLMQLFKVSEIKALDNSEYVRYCKSSNDKIRCSRKATVFKGFTAVRNYILMYLCFKKTSRVCTIANMTCQEYFNAIYNKGLQRVAVLDHNRLATFGPCVLVFTSVLYKKTKLFQCQFPNSLEGIDTNHRCHIS